MPVSLQVPPASCRYLWVLQAIRTHRNPWHHMQPASRCAAYALAPSARKSAAWQHLFLLTAALLSQPQSTSKYRFQNPGPSLKPQCGPLVALHGARLGGTQHREGAAPCAIAWNPFVAAVGVMVVAAHGVLESAAAVLCAPVLQVSRQLSIQNQSNDLPVLHFDQLCQARFAFPGVPEGMQLQRPRPLGALQQNTLYWQDLQLWFAMAQNLARKEIQR
mmetsp:Transcript_54826/g.109089  ORF Transcript_54826/g.109089 Transcript_54826/m.109089 type:complete len:218 (+) Transcript_54826:1865-2518(+)